MAYAQAHGTAAFQLYVQNRQRDLKKLLEDAVEWDRAPQEAAEEAVTDWALVCRTAEGLCPCGADCGYAAAVAEIFTNNHGTLSQTALAAQLRAIIVAGPSKTVRVPFLVGPTNTGKSTLVEPFNDLFGSHKVLHTPNHNSEYSLRNMLKNKRFMWWDEFYPVKHASKDSLPATEFMKLFNGYSIEVMVGQNHHDGNIDFAWKHGAVFAARKEGLWDEMPYVTAEEIRHMQSRVTLHDFTVPIPNLSEAGKCKFCMAKWIVQGAQEHDAAQVVGMRPGPPGGDAPPRQGAGDIAGLAQLLANALVPQDVSSALYREVLELGAVDVSELTASDWKCLASWDRLRPLEKRRVLSLVRGV